MTALSVVIQLFAALNRIFRKLIEPLIFQFELFALICDGLRSHLDHPESRELSTRLIAGKNYSLYGNYSHLWVVKRTEREVELNWEKVVVCAARDEEKVESFTTEKVEIFNKISKSGICFHHIIPTYSNHAKHLEIPLNFEPFYDIKFVEKSVWRSKTEIAEATREKNRPQIKSVRQIFTIFDRDLLRCWEMFGRKAINILLPKLNRWNGAWKW